jgi:hypothetical protein
METRLDIEKELIKLYHPSMSAEEVEAEASAKLRRQELLSKAAALQFKEENPGLKSMSEIMQDMQARGPNLMDTGPTVFDAIIDLLTDIRDLLKARSAS